MQASSAAPILRNAASGTDAVVVRWLLGGAVMAARLLAAVGGISLSRATGAAAATALALAIADARFGLPPIVVAVLVPLVTVGLVRLLVSSVARRAQKAFARGFPDALAIIIRALRAGLPITAAIAEAARSDIGPIARAFAGITEAMRLGQPLETALWSVAQSVAISDFDFFVVTIGLQRETRGNLAETLNGLDKTLRMRRQLAMNVSAMAAESRASAMIIGSLPFVMATLLWVTSPAYMVSLFTTDLGRALLGGGLLSIAIGGLIIRQIMQIKA